MKNPSSNTVESPRNDKRATLSLSQTVQEVLDTYFEGFHHDKPPHDSAGHALPIDVYALVMAEVEKPLLKKVLDVCQGNQSKAAKVLGMNRTTLRKKLRCYSMG